MGGRYLELSINAQRRLSRLLIKGLFIKFVPYVDMNGREQASVFFVHGSDISIVLYQLLIKMNGACNLFLDLWKEV